ncbi:MAG: ATP-binding protein, partial [Pseudomonadota bacterium]
PPRHPWPPLHLGRPPPRPPCVAAATNEPWSLDDAITRPGRFGVRVHVGLPDEEAREAILAMRLDGMPLSDEISLEELAIRTEGYSGADLMALCHRLGQIPFLESVQSDQIREVHLGDVDAALRSVRPSVTNRAMERFLRYEREAGG